MYISNYYYQWLENLFPLILYINANLTLFFGISFILLTLLGILILTRPTTTIQSTSVPQNLFTESDYSAIAGDDVIATQLDLAKAYIEMNQTTLAKPILDHVIKKGTPLQKQEARQLINSL